MAVIADHKFKLKKDDIVEIIAGKDKSTKAKVKRGRILKILRDKDRVLVEGLNLVKKTQKKRKQQDRGGIAEVEAAIHVSNVMIVCKKCGPTRIGFKLGGKDTKTGKPVKSRVCRKCGEAL